MKLTSQFSTIFFSVKYIIVSIKEYSFDQKIIC